MSKEFGRAGIDCLMNWILREEPTGEIFGISNELFFHPSPSDPFRMSRYGKTLETPIGVAAGPHTQMAQNIIASWLCGARYIELKTVQTLDELNVSKPCINVPDEGYNCEWSQELKLEDSFDEYLNAWIILHILRHKFGWMGTGDPGFIFNMSVGYNLEGILNPNVQIFLDRMAGCKQLLKEKLAIVRKYYKAVDEIDIPSRLSDNITLSTMHGCPPDEIEKIGTYLIREKGYHTTIKLNPTLLGPQQLRHILNDMLGWETIVPDEAFGHDLKYPDAVNILKNLQAAADEKNVAFSIKLTNTLECVNIHDVFPEHEKMMYMSGRALHAISISVAAKLQNEFNGALDISFSGGADCFNITKLIASGIKPVTICSDILKPGGYARMTQYLEELKASMKKESAKEIEEFILNFAGCSCRNVRKAALVNLRRYAGTVPTLAEFHSDYKTGTSVKTSRKLPKFDCISAPCVNTCPANQDIPSYLHYTAVGDYDKAFEVIRHGNPFPNVLGMVCDHHCQHKCTRTNYDNSILIREVKRFISSRAVEIGTEAVGLRNGKKVAVIGAGPSGLAAAYFLAFDGFEVKVFETKAFAGGMVSDAIPAFRLTEDAIRKDIEYIQKLGVSIEYSSKIDRGRFEQLRKEYDFVYVAVGAQGAKQMWVEGENTSGVIDCLKFLSNIRQSIRMEKMTRVIVVGGGNSAIDAARAAHRLVEPDGKVTVVYRRTRKEMPADPEEVRALLNERIEVLELHAPEKIESANGRVSALKCQKMKPGEKDASGRARPEKIPGEFAVIECDTVIAAIGQDTVVDFIYAEDFQIDPGTGMTRLENVFAGGDAVRGASTIVKAVGDGKAVARSITLKSGLSQANRAYSCEKGLDMTQYQRKSARRIRGIEVPEEKSVSKKGFDLVVRTLTEEEARMEAERCLYCSDVCNVCVTVCPNRANRYYKVPKGDFKVQKAVRRDSSYVLEELETLRMTQEVQTLNIGEFCNECGNCTTFCPTAGDPYKDKPKFYLTENCFQAESDGFHFKDGRLLCRTGGKQSLIERYNGSLCFESDEFSVTLNGETLKAEHVESKNGAGEFSLRQAVEMGILFKALHASCFV